MTDFIRSWCRFPLDECTCFEGPKRPVCRYPVDECTCEYEEPEMEEVIDEIRGEPK